MDINTSSILFIQEEDRVEFGSGAGRDILADQVIIKHLGWKKNSVTETASRTTGTLDQVWTYTQSPDMTVSIFDIVF